MAMGKNLPDLNKGKHPNTQNSKIIQYGMKYGVKYGHIKKSGCQNLPMRYNLLCSV